MIDLRIAIVCMHSVLGDIKGNLDRIAQWVGTAARETYCTVQDTARIMDRLIQMGQDMKMVLAVGFIENSGGKKPYIAQLITGPEGLIGIYRKTHLSPTESEIYELISHSSHGPFGPLTGSELI